MTTKTGKLLVTSASLLSCAALASACSCNAAADGSGGSGGVDGSGGAGTGGTSTGGNATGGLGGCPPVNEEPAEYMIWHSPQGGAGGEGGADSGASFVCISDFICQTADVPTPEFYPVSIAYATLGSTADSTPRTESGQANAVVTHPDPSRVCIKGDEEAGLGFDFDTAEFWDGEGAPELVAAPPIPWDELDITYVRFTIETPPSSGLTLAHLAFNNCEENSWFEANNEGNALDLSVDGATTTLPVNSVFGPDFAQNDANILFFSAPAGEYDYCIKDLEFLNADGEPVE